MDLVRRCKAGRLFFTFVCKAVLWEQRVNVGWVHPMDCVKMVGDVLHVHCGVLRP